MLNQNRLSLSSAALLTAAVASGLTPAAGGQVTNVRTIDGTGNGSGGSAGSLAGNDFGAAGAELIRLTPVRYADGVGELAAGPNVRAISNALAVQDPATFGQNPGNLSSFFWQFGQFLDHDLSVTPENHADPRPIAAPAGDPTFTPAHFISFDRSEAVAGTGTGAGNPRQFANAITTWIDGSNVYGSDATRQAALRDTDPATGRLAVGADGFMPRNLTGLANAGGDANPTLFLAGDIRANEQSGLTATHEVFTRYHNVIADGLRADNPGWTGDEVYETSRAIVGGTLQRITYDEWLPSLFAGSGRGLESYAGYDATVDPRLSAEFTTAAFRFGHTMLNRNLLRLNADGSEYVGPDGTGHLNLFGSFFQPDRITEVGGLDALVRGLVGQEANALDTMVVEDIRSLLFSEDGGPGLDLFALNLQRGRDHGIGTYNDVRSALGLSVAGDFADLTADAGLAAALEDVYGTGNVDDVDAFVGLLSEDFLGTSGLGETLAVIFADQFERLRDADAFWYENAEYTDLLPYRDLIEGTGLGDVLAATTGVTEFAGTNVFVAQAVPEPASVALLGLGGLLLTRRRRTGG